tara:strand:+ start:194 stop:319 length:126 start_codon:yes stop_codon:yes gene_type:complete
MKQLKKAEKCITRKKAQKIIKKYEKARIALHDTQRSDNTLI